MNDEPYAPLADRPGHPPTWKQIGGDGSLGCCRIEGESVRLPVLREMSLLSVCEQTDDVTELLDRPALSNLSVCPMHSARLSLAVCLFPAIREHVVSVCVSLCVFTCYWRVLPPVLILPRPRDKFYDRTKLSKADVSSISARRRTTNEYINRFNRTDTDTGLFYTVQATAFYLKPN